MKFGALRKVPEMGDQRSSSRESSKSVRRSDSVPHERRLKEGRSEVRPGIETSGTIDWKNGTAQNTDIVLNFRVLWNSVVS